MTFFMVTLFLGIACGIFLRPAWKRLEAAWERATESKYEKRNRRDRWQKELDAAEQRGRDAALSILAETDENAAIVAALASGVLRQQGMEPITPETDMAQLTYEMARFAVFVYRDHVWEWQDRQFERAGLSTISKTPREAHKKYLAQKAHAAMICEQLDEAERLRKEAVK